MSARPLMLLLLALAALADALDGLLDAAGYRRALGERAAGETRRRFAIEEHVRQLAQLYRRGVAERTGSGRALAGVER